MFQGDMALTNDMYDLWRVGLKWDVVPERMWQNNTVHYVISPLYGGFHRDGQVKPSRLASLPIQRIGHVPRLIVSYVGHKQRHFWRNGDKDTEGITKINGRRRKRNKYILQKSFPVEFQRLCLR